jgi:hypothetical protein
VPAARSHEQEDAIQRVRAEVNLLIGKYARRLKDEAETIALQAMLADPTRDPDEVGREAFAEAGRRLEILDGSEQPSSLGAGK